MKSFNMSSITLRCYNNKKEIVNRGILWKESGGLIIVIRQVKKIKIIRIAKETEKLHSLPDDFRKTAHQEL